MTDDEKLRHHVDLFDRTATRMGLDLEELAITGKLPFEEIAGAVLRCTNCAHPEDCALRLDTPSTAPVAAPEYCQNGELFKTL
jgi:hypothetical protein